MLCYCSLGNMIRMNIVVRGRLLHLVLFDRLRLVNNLLFYTSVMTPPCIKPLTIALGACDEYSVTNQNIAN